MKDKEQRKMTANMFFYYLKILKERQENDFLFTIEQNWKAGLSYWQDLKTNKNKKIKMRQDLAFAYLQAKLSAIRHGAYATTFYFIFEAQRENITLENLGTTSDELKELQELAELRLELLEPVDIAKHLKKLQNMARENPSSNTLSDVIRLYRSKTSYALRFYLWILIADLAPTFADDSVKSFLNEELNNKLWSNAARAVIEGKKLKMNEVSGTVLRFGDKKSLSIVN